MLVTRWFFNLFLRYELLLWTYLLFGLLMIIDPALRGKGTQGGQSLTYGMSLGRHWVYLMPATAADLL